MLANRVREFTTTAGAGDITLDGALSGHIRFADGFSVGDTVTYVIEDGDDYEIGQGTLIDENTLERTTPSETLVSGVYDKASPGAISLSGNAKVFCAATAEFLLDPTVDADVIREVTPDTGVTVDGVILKDGSVTATTATISGDVGIGVNPAGDFHIQGNQDTRIGGVGSSYYTYFQSNSGSSRGSLGALLTSFRVQAQSSGNLELFNTQGLGITVNNGTGDALFNGAINTLTPPGVNARFNLEASTFTPIFSMYSGGTAIQPIIKYGTGVGATKLRFQKIAPGTGADAAGTNALTLNDDLSATFFGDLEAPRGYFGSNTTADDKLVVSDGGLSIGGSGGGLPVGSGSWLRMGYNANTGRGSIYAFDYGGASGTPLDLDIQSTGGDTRFGGNIALSGSLISRTVDAGGLTIAAGDTSSSGSNFILRGPNSSVNPNDWEFRTGTTVRFQWDHGEAHFDFKNNPIINIGRLQADGGAKISVQNKVDGGSDNGLFLYDTDNTDWGVYMAQPGTGKSLGDGTACSSLDGRSWWAVRNRVANGENYSFIWENSSEQCLMSLTGNTGELYTRGNAVIGNGTTASNLTVNAGASWADINLSSANTNGGSINWIDPESSGATPSAEIFYYHVTNVMDIKTLGVTALSIDDKQSVRASGLLTVDGGAKIGVQNKYNGGSGHGLFLWDTDDTNWAAYMSQAGVGKSIADGTACSSLDGRSSYAIRNRVFGGTGNSFIWENGYEQCLMSLTGDTGNLYVKGQFVAPWDQGFKFNAGAAAIKAGGSGGNTVAIQGGSASADILTLLDHTGTARFNIGATGQLTLGHNNIVRNNANTGIYISGGPASNEGANLYMIGGSHPGNPYAIAFRKDLQDVLYFDGANTWDYKGQNVIGIAELTTSAAVIGPGTAAPITPGDLAIRGETSFAEITLHSGASGSRYASISADGSTNNVTLENFMGGGVGKFVFANPVQHRDTLEIAPATGTPTLQFAGSGFSGQLVDNAATPRPFLRYFWDATDGNTVDLLEHSGASQIRLTQLNGIEFTGTSNFQGNNIVGVNAVTLATAFVSNGIVSNNTTDSLTVSGSNGINVGANLLLFANDHPTNSNDWVFRSNAQNRVSWDDAGQTLTVDGSLDLLDNSIVGVSDILRNSTSNRLLLGGGSVSDRGAVIILRSELASGDASDFIIRTENQDRVRFDHSALCWSFNHKIRLPETGDVSAISTGHAFQIGATSTHNLAFDANEIMARNNGLPSKLHLQIEGGNVEFGGQIIARVGGSGGVPAYSFTNDPDTGMYQPSLGLLGFATNGLERVLIGEDTGVTNNNGLWITNGGSVPLVVGADNDGRALTNNHNKIGRVAVPHYTNDEEPFVWVRADSNSTQNILNLGGGTSLGNAATEINFWTATNSTTVSGDNKWRMINNEFVGVSGNTIRRAVANDALTVAGGNGADDGGSIRVFGSGHSERPGSIIFRQDTDLILEWDAPNTRWDFNDTDIENVGRLASTGTINLTNLPVHETDAEAASGGLAAGDVYRTSAGDLKVKL